MLKTCVCTVWTWGKKMAAIFNSCEELWAKMCSTVYASPFAVEQEAASESSHYLWGSARVRFCAVFFEKKQNKTSACTLSIVIPEEKVLI